MVNFKIAINIKMWYTTTSKIIFISLFLQLWNYMFKGQHSKINILKEGKNMPYAFSDVLGTEWNDEVVEYLASKFNSTNPRIIVLSKTVFINATLVKFDDVSFIIYAANEYLELSFAKVDTDKMEAVIQEILKWDAFAKHSSRFYVKVDMNTSRSIVFDTGKRQSQNDYKRHFHRYETEIISIKKL